MKYDFHAEYSLQGRYIHVQKAAVDFLAGDAARRPKEWPALDDVQDFMARRYLLVQTQAPPAVYKEYARVGMGREKGGLLKGMQRGGAQEYLGQQWKHLEQMGLLTPTFDLTLLPPLSFVVQFTFCLRKPYISRDDVAWDVWDNPIKKEWVWRLPYVAPAGWKGALRAALRPADDKVILRLFGKAGDEAEGQRGRLRFYPTFFDAIGLEVINPHGRKTGAGTHPIYFECVPAGAVGKFTLLYAPLDWVGALRDEVVGDLRAAAEGVRAMFTEYGLGAKTSSGFGTAEATFAEPGWWGINVVEQPTETEYTPPPAPVEPALAPPEVCRPFMREGQFPKYSKQALGAMVKRGEWSKNQRTRYKRARQAYQEWQDRREAYNRARAAREVWKRPQPTRRLLRPVRVTNFGAEEHEGSLAWAANRLAAGVNGEW